MIGDRRRQRRTHYASAAAAAVRPSPTRHVHALDWTYGCYCHALVTCFGVPPALWRVPQLLGVSRRHCEATVASTAHTTAVPDASGSRARVRGYATAQSEPWLCPSLWRACWHAGTRRLQRRGLATSSCGLAWQRCARNRCHATTKVRAQVAAAGELRLVQPAVPCVCALVP